MPKRRKNEDTMSTTETSALAVQAATSATGRRFSPLASAKFKHNLRWANWAPAVITFVLAAALWQITAIANPYVIPTIDHAEVHRDRACRVLPDARQLACRAPRCG